MKRGGSAIEGLNIGGIYTKMNPADSVFVKIPCAQAKSGCVVLLVDSGADTSLVKYGSLTEGVEIDKMVVKNLRGAFGGFSRTTGCVELGHTEHTDLVFKMHCIEEEGDNLPGDGILGRDNLWGRSVMDTVALLLKIYSVGGEWGLPLIPLRKLEGACTVNTMGHVTIAKARAMTIASMYLDTKHATVVIDKAEISPGVYLGAAVTDVRDGQVHAPILNATETDFRLPREFKPKFSAFAKYKGTHEGLMAQVQEVNIEERVELILKTIKIDVELNPEERRSIEDICASYHDVFWLEGDKLSCTNVVKHNIPVKADQLPINQKQYRLPQIHREEITRQVRKMEEDGIITHSLSPWNSPLLLVPKISPL